jgi:E3 ubiquitin-protein ligase TRIP12
MILNYEYVLCSDDLIVDDLIFTVQPGGRDIAVTMENVDDYIHEALNAIIGKGAQIQAKAFKDGFSKVFPIMDLQAFSADELVMLFGNSDEDWSAESKIQSSLFACILTLFSSALVEVLKADHGFHVESRAIRDLVEIMSSYDPPMRRAFLQFITGSPKLPIGGTYHALDDSHIIYSNHQVSVA